MMLRWQNVAAAILTLVTMLGGVAPAQQSQDVVNLLVKVVTVSQEGLRDKPGSELLAATLTRLDRAASFRPDIACLPEVFTRGEPEPLTGPTVTRVARWAREHNCYVICPLLTQFEGRVYNSAVLLDRQGQIAGRYDKIHPTESELERDITPGVSEPPVFETDFGKIGVQICFDVNWRDSWASLKSQGADIIFFPSAFPADRQLQSLAWLNQCFVVSATITRAATIYDITGDKIATTGKYQNWAAATLPLGKRLFEIDYHVGKLREIQSRYGDRVQITWYHDDDLVSLASLDPKLSVAEIIREFQLTPHSDYITRAGAAQEQRRTAAEKEEKE